jgi:hypothetical protein
VTSGPDSPAHHTADHHTAAHYAVAVVSDLLAVLAFVVIGRSAHDDAEGLSGLAHTAWPFLVGLAAGWVLAALLRRGPVEPVTGFAVLGGTVFGGMLLRALVEHDPPPPAFLLVTTGFLGIVMCGWRLLARRAAARAAAR